MLNALKIRDFAIIDELELALRPGLTVLTGETGAGKSILVDALQLIAGGRAGAEMIRHGAERADISATFEVHDAPPELREWLERQAIAEDELIVRRLLAGDGRSRAWLNGQPVPVQLLREAGSLLIDIHGQHEFQSLARAARQRELLDEYGELATRLGEVGEAYQRWRQLRVNERELAEAARDRDARLDLLRHQVGELGALKLEAGELERLSEERRASLTGAGSPRPRRGRSNCSTRMRRAMPTGASAARCRRCAGPWRSTRSCSRSSRWRRRPR